MTESVLDPADLAHRLAALGGDPCPEALLAEVDALFVAHQGRVLALCRRYTGDPQRAAELAQDALLRGYQKLPTFRGESRFSTWLLGIARYECLNALRRHDERLTEDGVLDPADPAPSVLTAVHRTQRDALVAAAAAAVLAPVEQQVVHLRYVELLPLAQIDRILPRGEGDARGVLQRSRRRLSRELRRRLATLGHGSSYAKGSQP